MTSMDLGSLLSDLVAAKKRMREKGTLYVIVLNQISTCIVKAHNNNTCVNPHYWVFFKHLQWRRKWLQRTSET